MAIDKLEKENGAGEYNQQIEAYKKKIEDVGKLTKTKTDVAVQTKLALDSEWEDINEPGDKWKKKAIYD